MTETGSLLLTFFIVCGLGVFTGGLPGNEKHAACVSIIGSVASLALLTASGIVLLSGRAFSMALWALPLFGKMMLGMDRMSALFLFITGMVFLPVSIFSAGYLKRYTGRYSLKSFAVFYFLLFASIALTLMAMDVLSFVIGWEAMSLLGYLLVNYEHEQADTTRSGMVMLLMSEAGTLAVILAFVILARTTGDMGFASLRAGAVHLGAVAGWFVFLLSFFGFGVKAGLVPVNSWLPMAHPVAPGNVSAILSGVILNLGIYGIVRINADILPIAGTGQGLVVLLIGTLSALVGILYATPEDDMKKMLAHSSIENMGIVTAGLGAGFVFLTSGHPVPAGLAFIAALYHMTNHSLYKALLFLGAGSVDMQVGSRHMQGLGGLIRRMPWTALFFLVGALSIAALPPFNGFVSEWLTLQTLLQCAVLPSKAVKITFALCGAGLALTAALAVTCFVKAFAMNFLGKERSEKAAKATEAAPSMTISMGILAVACFLFGILPTYVIPAMDRVVQPYVHVSAVDQLVPPFFTVGRGNDKFDRTFVADFHKLGAQVGSRVLPGRGLVIMHRGGKRNPVIFAMSPAYTVAVLLLLLGGTFLIIRLLTRRRSLTHGPAWSGGLGRLPPEMTYSATGFSNPVRVIFRGIFRPVTVRDARETVANHFRSAIRKDQLEIHMIDRLFGKPIVHYGRRLAERLGRMHSGRVNAYAAYVLAALLAVLLIQGLA